MLYACAARPEDGYNPNNGRGIFMRTAANPWGPWSLPTLVFDPNRGGYCHFMNGLSCPSGTNNALDISQGLLIPGGEYAPLLLPARYMKADEDTLTVYFTMSTWNPYQVVLMRSRLTIPPWWDISETDWRAGGSLLGALGR